MALTQTDLGGYLKCIASGKVRDLYEIDKSTLLFVATDRISAYDVVMENGIPMKGKLLTMLSAFWFDILSKQIPALRTHLITLELPPTVGDQLPPELQQNLKGRSMQVRKLRVFPIEAIVRGYITGSAWVEYQRTVTVHGLTVPEGLRESEKLPEPMYTPSTKAELGGKDENIHPEKAAEIVGKEYAQKIQDLALELYSKAHAYAQTRGIIIADTKFEFGLDESTSPPSVVLVDEVLTPDSSRFWPASSYVVGRSQDSFDKQYLRDWLTSQGLKGKDGVVIPDEIVEKTAEKYKEAFERLTGETLC